MSKAKNQGQEYYIQNGFWADLSSSNVKLRILKESKCLQSQFLILLNIKLLTSKHFEAFFFIHYAFESNPISFGNNTMFLIIEGVGIFRAKQEAQ